MISGKIYITVSWADLPIIISMRGQYDKMRTTYILYWWHNDSSSSLSGTDDDKSVQSTMSLQSKAGRTRLGNHQFHRYVLSFGLWWSSHSVVCLLHWRGTVVSPKLHGPSWGQGNSSLVFLQQRPRAHNYEWIAPHLRLPFSMSLLHW